MQPVALPTGRVVFLFSDIEGSTRRWDADPTAMQAALRRHDEIVRGEAERRAGYVFKTIGDAFCIAFQNIQDALEAAVDSQRRLSREKFDALGVLDVRMAVHAGESDERGGDYFGPPVNRTARLLSAGHGGQILLSGFAAELAMERVPAGVTFRHLGVLPLRDLKEPESVFQVIAAGLRSEFKPLRALQTPPNNLPHQTTSFVGREEDALAVEALLDSGSLVTIVGAGGIGKTRLALRVALARLNDEPDGVWFVDLASIAGGELISRTVLSTVGAEPTGDDALEQLLKWLGPRKLLLLLDNSEHIVSEVAAVVSAVVAGCPHVTVLATSRTPLDMGAERVYRLSTLDAASAVQLFTDRGMAVNRHFAVEGNFGTIEDICRRLDGIALAIELAAARVRMMPLADIASHLELRLLAGGRDRRPRQQTMRALIDWSYDLLTADEQVVLQRCAVFVRGWALNASSYVFALEDNDHWRGFELLASLVDKSLVSSEGQDDALRYRLLEPIREYAFEKLTQSGQLIEAQRRHAKAFALVAQQAYREWDVGPAAHWLSRIEADLANVREALRWTLAEENDPTCGVAIAADIAPVFLRLALLDEGIGWCERALAMGIAAGPEVEARLHYGLSMLYSNIGANDKVLEEALIAASLYRASDDARGVARALSQVASRAATAARYAEAISAAQEALQRARNLDDRRLLADTLRRCAEAFENEGADVVRKAYEESVALFRSLGRPDETARALGWWGQWEARAGHFGAAAELLREAKRLEIRDVAIMFVANDIASCYLAIGDYVQAAPFAREALEIAARARHVLISAMSVAYFAVMAGANEAARAAGLLGYSEKALREARWRRVDYEQRIIDQLYDGLKGVLPETELNGYLAEGGDWTLERAVSEALAGAVESA